MNRNYLFIIAGFILAGILIWYGVKSTTSTDDSLPKTAVLTLETEDKVIKSGDEFAVNLVLDSADSEVAAADFVLRFNPKAIEVTDVKTGNYFSNYPINTKTSDSVKISGVASYDGEAIVLPKGRDSVALITFRSKTKGKTRIGFDTKKTIVATDGQNILDSRNLSDLEVTISD